MHVENAGIYSAFASLYNILRKDVEQDTLAQASMPLATMPKTLTFTAFSLLCTTYCARMWNKTRCHKRTCLSRPCQKMLVFTAFRPLCTTYCARMEQDKTGFHKHPYLWQPCPTQVCPAFWPLYNMLRKDVEQDSLSQAPMLLSIMHTTLVFTLRAHGCGTRHVVTSVHAFGDRA